MKVLVARATSPGEQINVEIEATAWDDKDWNNRIGFVLRKLDERMKDMNHRYLDALGVVDIFPPEYRASFKQAIDILHSDGPKERLQMIAQLRKKPADGTGEAEATPAGANVVELPGPEVAV
jgi:hypothetical protein